MRFRTHAIASIASSAKKMRRSSNEANAGLFWPVLLFVIGIDLITKQLAEARLFPKRIPHEVFGDWFRFTLVYNPGAAFGLHVGEHSRWVFTFLTILALVILSRLYQTTREGDTRRVLALALVCGGAIGNLVDRLKFRSSGVVDFIDIGFGDSRWPTFNLADVAVSTGAFVLAYVLWQEDRQAVAVVPPVVVPSESGEVS
jgi:signal peptidase II